MPNKKNGHRRPQKTVTIKPICPFCGPDDRFAGKSVFPRWFFCGPRWPFLRGRPLYMYLDLGGRNGHPHSHSGTQNMGLVSFTLSLPLPSPLPQPILCRKVFFGYIHPAIRPVFSVADSELCSKAMLLSCELILILPGIIKIFLRFSFQILDGCVFCARC